MIPISIEDLKTSLPAKMQKVINQELADNINSTLAHPELYKVYRENFISYAKVMADGRFSIPEYLNAIKYVTHKLSGCTNKEAFARTFPDKNREWVAAGVTEKTISVYVHAYNQSKLVMLIFEQAIIPTWLVNQELYQKALNVQAELMLTARSEKVRSDAANSILTHLKTPETQKIQLSIGVPEHDSIKELRNETARLVEAQRLSITSQQSTAQDIAHNPIFSSIVDAE